MPVWHRMTTGAVVLAVLAGASLIAIELARSVPAWLHVRRTRSAAGLSAVSTGVLTGSSIGWIAVAALTDSWAALMATIVWLIFHVLLWREMSRVNSAVVRTINWATIVSLIALSVIAFVGFSIGRLEDALGVAIGAAAAAYTVPALVEGMRGPSTSGLSLASLTVNSLEGGIYLVGGLGLGGITPVGTIVPGYIIFASATIGSNLPRLVRTGIRRLRHKDQPNEQKLATIDERIF